MVLDIQFHLGQVPHRRLITETILTFSTITFLLASDDLDPRQLSLTRMQNQFRNLESKASRIL